MVKACGVLRGVISNSVAEIFRYPEMRQNRMYLFSNADSCMTALHP
jgi:hypothetical protein